MATSCVPVPLLLSAVLLFFFCHFTPAAAAIGRCQVDIYCEECTVPRTLQCPTGQVLHIVSSVYGRSDTTTCPHMSDSDTSCARNDLTRTRNNCEGNQT